MRAAGVREKGGEDRRKGAQAAERSRAGPRRNLPARPNEAGADDDGRAGPPRAKRRFL
jgi:hypothetical protein